MKISLIISTYNRPEALKLCLISAFSQRRKPDEIIVSDDGSCDATAHLIAELRDFTDVPLLHVWQEDNGFRLAKARNKAVAVASGDYIIETDDDMIMHPDFVGDHENFALSGHFLKGGLSNLGRRLTERLCSIGRLPRLRWYTRGLEVKARKAMHIPFIARLLASRAGRSNPLSPVGNMSFFRSDFMAVNGYDESIAGRGGEDRDFGRRMQAAGLRMRRLKFAGIVFHLWHTDKFKQTGDDNRRRSLRDGIGSRCVDGVDKYKGPFRTDSLGRVVPD